MPPSSQHATQTGPDLRFLFSELVRLEAELWSAVEGRLRTDFRVALPVFEFMEVISRTQDCQVQDIAAELSITVGGTSKIVDRIEASGYCSRSANPSERRSSVIKLTPAGKRLLPKLAGAVDDGLRKLLGAAGTDQSLVRLTKALTKVRSAVGPWAQPRRQLD